MGSLSFRSGRPAAGDERDRAGRAGSRAAAPPSPARRLAGLQSLIGNRAMARLHRKPKPEIDPRAAPGHRDPLIKVPAKGAPMIEHLEQGVRSITWSWEVERPGTPQTGGQAYREQVYWATFEVDAHGVMRVSARMVSPSGQFRAPEWSLRGKFKEAVDLFRSNGITVTAFEAEWGYMGPGEISGNLDTFLGEMKANPKAMQADAARATPSGKVALGNGFMDVRVVTEPGYEPSQVTGPTKVKQSRPVVRVRFSVPAGTPVPAGGGAGGPRGTGKPGVSAGAEGAPRVALPPGEGGRVPRGEGAAGPKAGSAWAPKAIAAGLVEVLAPVLIIELSKAWLTYEKNVADPKELEFRNKLAGDITPGIEKALEARTDEARKLTAQHPEMPIFAQITIDMDFTWEGFSPAEKKAAEFKEARFVDLALSFSKREKSGELVARPTNIKESIAKHIGTRRVTYSVEINPMEETRDQRKWRAMVAQAEVAVRHKVSVRAVGEHTHWVGEGPGYAGHSWTHDDEAEERRRKKFGLPSWREELERRERKLWATAYIAYTGERDLHPQYEEGVRYYQELEAAEAADRAKREKPSLDPQRMSPDEKRKLVEWLEQSR